MSNAKGGRFMVRTGPHLHTELEAEAQLEGISLNQLAVALLAEGLGRRRSERRARAATQKAGDASISYAWPSRRA